MFSCCCSSSSPVSNLEKPRSSTLSRRLRCGLIPHPRRLWPFTRKKPKHSIQGSNCVCGLDQDLDETCVVRTVKAGSLEKLVEHLVPAFTEGDFSYIDIFLGTYRTFATTQLVLELLFQRYGYNCPHSAGDGGPQDQQKDLLKTWMDEYPEDFDQPAHLPCLKLLVEYLQVNMPGSDLEHRALLLCAQLDHLEPKEAEPEGEED
uniref:N-terminal Ras-GEF domain-containing protein n=1 Tax=Loxodonta africana TaxID=9785 RepID=G3TRC5_LOXAF